MGEALQVPPVGGLLEVKQYSVREAVHTGQSTAIFRQYSVPGWSWLALITRPLALVSIRRE